MRLFVAVTPPRHVLLELRAAVESLAHGNGCRARGRGEVTENHRIAPVPANLRWVRPDLWHITVAFLGEVEPERLDDLRDRLSRAAARAVPMELSLAHAGRFGQHTLWIGVGGDRDRLARLATSVNAAARRCHVAVQDTPYRPHLTLARLRGEAEPGACSLDDLVAHADGFRSPGWFAGELDLVRSYPGPAPRYERIDRWPLTGR